MDPALAELAAHGCDPATTRQLLSQLEGQAGSAWFYVFWLSGGGAAPTAPRRPRTIVGFANPDAALAFAQGNGASLGETGARLRRLSLPQLLLALVREETIEALLLARDVDGRLPPGHLPEGVSVERAQVLKQLMP